MYCGLISLSVLLPLAFCSFQTQYHLLQRLNSFKCVPYGKGLKAGKDN